VDDPVPGARIDDFTVAHVITRGMNADVLAVWHHELLVPLVCKRLRPALAGDGRHRRRLRTEGEALALMNHPGIVRIIDQQHRIALPYLLIEHVGERTLRDRLDDEGPLDADEAVRTVQHVAAAVAHVHRRGFIHRDLKPSNIVVRAGRPVLLDFGVVWPLGARRRPPDRCGTPQYLAPEQIARTVLGPPTDVYGLGILLFELLTGERPFGAVHAAADRSATARFPQLTESPRPLVVLRPDVPADLDAVVARCLARDPSSRFASVVALMRALDPFTAVKVWPQSALSAERDAFAPAPPHRRLA
jgi:eukaryotic-like serine/threonine-protein kinase